MKLSRGLSAVCLCLAIGMYPQTRASAIESRTPSIVVIVADDQGYADLGCAGLVNDVRTPGLDRLARRGTRFLQAYATSSICHASRAGLITGCCQARQGIFGYGGPGIHRKQLPTIAELLRAAGYATGYTGKFHYGGGTTHDPESRSFPLNHGFGEFYGFGGERKHYLIHNAEAEAVFLQIQTEQARPGQSLQQGALWRNRRQIDQRGFLTELFGEQARRFIGKHRDRPFFLQLAFNAVHDFTHQLPEKYLQAQNLKGYYDWDAASEDYDEWYRRGHRPENPEGRAHYLGQLHYLDLEVGRILDYLDQTGLRENTLVIYIGDNGGSTSIHADNGPLRGSRDTLYEGGIRVPLIISWPGQVRQGKLSGNIVSAMDLLPTICAATGVQIPDHLDGQNILPLLTGTDTSLSHQTLVWDTGHETAVRHGKWKLKTAQHRQRAGLQMADQIPGEFLYDLDSDPGETKDLASTYPEVFTRLKMIYADWRAGLKSR